MLASLFTLLQRGFGCIFVRVFAFSRKGRRNHRLILFCFGRYFIFCLVNLLRAPSGTKTFLRKIIGCDLND